MLILGLTKLSDLALRAFGGLDWVGQKHSVIVADPHRQSDRILRDRTFGFRLEEVPRTNPSVRFDSFCDRDQPVIRKSGIGRAEQQETCQRES
jgi:hypothetical protein